MTARKLRIGWMALALITACSAPQTGGQSGTDAPIVACARPSAGSVPLDQQTSLWTGRTLSDSFEAALRSVDEVPLVWAPEFAPPTTITIEVVRIGLASVVSSRGPGNCADQLEVEVTLHLSTADGMFDETLIGHVIKIVNGGENHAIVGYARELQGSAFGERLATAFELEPDALHGMTVDLTFRDDYEGIAGQISVDADADSTDVNVLHNLADIDSTLPASPTTHEHYVRPAVFDAECAAVQPTMQALDAFTSDQAMLDALTGHWLRCSGDASNVGPYAGLEIDANRTWHYLVLQDGALVEQVGFLREGLVGIAETAPYNGPNWRQFNLGYGPEPAVGANELEFSNDRQTMRIATYDIGSDPLAYDDIYQRTQMPVTAPNIPREDGERAGSAACAEGEAHVRAFSSADELRDALTGKWAICSGGLRRGATAVAFSRDGTYEQVDDQGHVVVTGHYEIDDSAGVQARMRDDDTTAEQRRGEYYGLAPWLSMAPLKLWFGDERRTVLSAMP
jgi:hypothetical protein